MLLKSLQKSYKITLPFINEITKGVKPQIKSEGRATASIFHTINIVLQ